MSANVCSSRSSLCPGCASLESDFLFFLLFRVWVSSWNSSLGCRNGGCRGRCCWPCYSQPCVQLVFLQQVAHLGPDFFFIIIFSERKVLNQATVLAWWLIVICPLTSPNHISSITGSTHDLFSFPLFCFLNIFIYLNITTQLFHSSFPFCSPNPPMWPPLSFIFMASLSLLVVTGLII